MAQKQPGHVKIFSFTFLLPTLFGIGKIKYMPGTFGSFVAILDFSSYLLLGGIRFLDVPAFFFALFLVFVMGSYFTLLYLKETKKEDPSEVIIDEFFGQYVSLIIVYFSMVKLNPYFFETTSNVIITLAIAFVTFRFFDIKKMWLVKKLDQRKDVIGVIGDDLVAGVFSGVITLATILLYRLF